MKPKKLLLAGSHAATPAYAVTQEIKKRKLPWEIHFIGKRWSTEDKKSETLEYLELPKLGVKFHSIDPGKVQTKFTRYTLSAFFKIPFGFIQSLVQVAKVRPDATLSFGGAGGAEVTFWSWIMGIPVIVHEQTSVAGRANIFSARFAKQIMISRDASRKFFPPSKTILAGNPLSPQLGQPSVRPFPHTLLVTGGSRGSVRINEAIEKIMPRLKSKFEVIHLTGTGKGRLSISQMADALKKADIVVARAGANTTAEIIALKKPSVLVPIPWTYMNEQTRNAEFAKEFGIARILPQDELTPERLEDEIQKLAADYPNIVEKVKGKVSPDVNATKKVVDILEKYI